MLEPEVQTVDAPEAAGAPDAPPQPGQAAERDAEAGAEAGAENEPRAPEGALLEEDLLVEDVSIDGMCGVY